MDNGIMPPDPCYDRGRRPEEPEGSSHPDGPGGRKFRPAEKILLPFQKFFRPGKFSREKPATDLKKTAVPA